MHEPHNDGQHTGEGVTLDLAARTRATSTPDHPAIAEAKLQARGRHLIIAGCALTGAVLAVSIVWHIGFGTFLPASYTIPLYAASCGAILLGLTEYIGRPSRGLQAEALRIALLVQADQLRLVDLLDEELKQRYFTGCADTLKDSYPQLRTGTGPAAGRAPVNRSGADVVKLQRRVDRNDSLF
jgi:hypothetical protein